MTQVAIVHDYLTQRGGAERVVLSMLKAFPDAPLYTSFYDAGSTFPEFARADIRTMPFDRIPFLRRNHRLALPMLAPAFSRLSVTADVVLCSSSGWAHGVAVKGRKVVYCYSPARWLYQTQRYLGTSRPFARMALRTLSPYLLRWDRRAASSADSYITSSTAVAERIRSSYGLEPTIIPPPHTLDPSGELLPIEELEPGFILCVSRLLPYKNLEPLLEAFRGFDGLRLVVVGTGPDSSRLRALAPANVRFVGSVPDQQLRWLYSQSAGLIAASYEDYGLTPLEASAFGRPACVLRWGGFLDTLVEGRTGVYFDRPDPPSIRTAVAELVATKFHPDDLRHHAKTYSEPSFIARLKVAILEGGSNGS